MMPLISPSTNENETPGKGSVGVLPYDLPDAALLGYPPGDRYPKYPGDRYREYRHMVWEPRGLSVVLGQGDAAPTALYLERIRREGVPVYRRPSGGGAVVLTPRMVVISVVIPVGEPGKNLGSPLRYFSLINRLIMDGLRALGVENPMARGISDLCLGDKKILGSSIYRNRDLVFYHGVLNRAEPVETLGRYLRHPDREPAYRRGRSHGEFVTSLTVGGYPLAGAEVCSALRAPLRRYGHAVRKAADDNIEKN